MQKLEENYKNKDEGIEGELVEVNRKLESLKGKVNELVDWIFQHNNPPDWFHQELIEKILKRFAESVERNIDKK